MSEATAYPLPKWGLTMEEGTLTEWYVEPGDPVREGEPIALVTTDKIEIEMESPATGIVVECLVPEGTTVAVGTPVVAIAPAEAGEERGGG